MLLTSANQSAATLPGPREQIGQFRPSLETIYIIFTLILYSSGFFLLLVSQGEFVARSVESNPLIQVLFLATYGIATVYLFPFIKLMGATLTKNWMLLLLVTMATLSIFWSNEPTLTFRRSIALWGTTVVGIYLGCRYTLRQQLGLLTFVCILIMIFSIAFALFWPEYGVMNEYLLEGDWRGVFIHKNTLGRVMVLGLLSTSLYTNYSNRLTKLAYISATLLFIVTLYFSQSVSSWIAAISLIIVVPFLVIHRLPFYIELAIVLLLLPIIISFLILFIDQADIILAVLGRDNTLTGRIELWNIFIKLIERKLLLGYGYSGFWAEDSLVYQVVLRTAWKEMPSSTHNGFLEIFLDLGIIGFLVSICCLLTTFLRGVALIRVHRSTESFWPLSFLVILFISNLTESLFLRHNSLIWVLFVAVNVTLVMRQTNFSQYK